MAYKTIYPYNNKVLKEYENASDEDLEQALSAGHQVYQQWRTEDPRSRGVVLQKVADLMKQKRTDLAQAMTYDMGKLLTESLGEVDLCIWIAEYYAEHGSYLLQPEPLDTKKGHGYYLKQATGVLVAVEPWNFPLYQVMRVFAPNYMVGNPIILKSASICPTSVQMFADLVQDAGAPKGAFTNLFIDYDQVARAIEDPRVAGVCLTGSERAGASVAQSAGKALKKSTLELGGNDAFIILADADWDELKQVVPQARLYNAGQVCTSSKRFIVMDSMYDQFLELLQAAFSQVKMGDPMDKATTLAPLSSKGAKEKLQSQVDAAIAGGAQVYYGNQPVDLPGQFFQPTILTDIAHDNPIFNQELFGPVASVYRVHDEAEAIALANDSSYGLGGTVFSSDLEHAKKVAAQVETGMSFINAGWSSTPDMPFGGVKNSGYGRELSALGIESFINYHLVLEP
ncbi:Succinate-semialdehyde dehydrogenase [Bombilactobacillus mellis]|uniref:Succinate-semialdehyde dehydrogenase n=1 Tax=Bombilactobacillus mellis TaxID=1218508 RepID=V5T8Z2_9LACO|nr:NAD-dependent succinate-semialdehyde dehydrogenase [Bombilactobacillus mellis]AHB59857.1 succinate-semialdehyde dehydrogenase [Bombilactobacillus mellis]KJY48293.1 Succinate-semialdehyde dehydrogenase [Bombilactobacillus mellis]